MLHYLNKFFLQCDSHFFLLIFILCYDCCRLKSILNFALFEDLAMLPHCITHFQSYWGYCQNFEFIIENNFNGVVEVNDFFANDL